jgi:hypothetical protein
MEDRTPYKVWRSWMNGLSGSHSAEDPKDTTLPLWRRTQLRLQNMETWSAQRRNTSDGFDERIQLQDQRIALAARHLVLLLKEREERAH